MITDAIISVFLGVIGAILGTFSVDGGDTGDLSNTLDAFGWALKEGGRLFPVDLALNFIVAGFAFDAAITGAQVSLMIYRLIPAKAT